MKAIIITILLLIPLNTYATVNYDFIEFTLSLEQELWTDLVFDLIFNELLWKK